MNEIYLDSSVIAKALGVRECKHPLDGGTVHTRGFDFNPTSSVTPEQQVIDILRPLKVKGVYTCELMDVMSVENPGLLVTKLKVRAIFE